MGLKVSHSVLSTALARVLPFASNEEARPVLECVYFEGNQEKQSMTVTTANGWIMGNVEIPAVVDGPFEKAIHGEVLKGFTAARSRFDVLVDFEDSMKNEFIWEGSKYPDYRKIFPTDGFVINAEVIFPLREALKRMKDFYKFTKRSIHSNSYSAGVCWSISSKGHVLEMEYEQGKVRFEIPTSVPIDIKPIYVAINVNWICQVLDAAKDLDDLRVGMIAKNSVVVFSSTKGAARWAVMPMHFPDYVAKEIE